MKRRVLFSLAILLFLLSGCIKIHMDQVVLPNGDSDVTITYDFSPMMGLAAAQMNESNMTNGSMDMGMAMPSCEDMDSDELALLDRQCTVTDDNKMIITGRLPKEESAVIVTNGIPYKTYEIDVAKAKGLAGDSDDLNAGAPPGADGSADMLKMMGMEFTYTLTMPGTISAAAIGEVDGNTVTIDLLEVEEGEQLHVTSRTLNLMPTAAIGGGVLLVIIILFVLLAKHGKRKREAMPSEPSTAGPDPATPTSGAPIEPKTLGAIGGSPPSPQLVDYVQKQRAKGMPNDAIRSALQKAGYRPDEINAVLK